MKYLFNVLLYSVADDADLKFFTFIYINENGAVFAYFGTDVMLAL